jgi:hypothetical protein
MIITIQIQQAPHALQVLDVLQVQLDVQDARLDTTKAQPVSALLWRTVYRVVLFLHLDALVAYMDIIGMDRHAQPK